MPLITRVTRLFRADFHAILDRIEEPDVLLRQSVREMEQDNAETEQQIKLLKHEHEQLSRRLGDLNQSLSHIEQQLDVCFNSNNDTLAKTLIKRKLETQRLNQHLKRKSKDVSQIINEQEGKLEENIQRLSVMQQKVEILSEECNTLSPDYNDFSTDYSVKDEDIEVAFLQEQQRRKSS